MRTIIEVPSEQLTHLDAHCRREGISRAEAIRRAVTTMLAERSKGHQGAEAFGLWRGRTGDALAQQERLRNEWR